MKALFAVLIAGALALSLRLWAQGDLNPPGPPGPTMKTLAQVEPRIPIDALHTPGTGGSSFEITHPGSYYLTGDIGGTTGKIGLSVQSSNVSIDLMGFGIFGTTSTTTSPGIFVGGDHAGVVIENGSVSQWLEGIVSEGRNLTVRNIQCWSNSTVGLRGGDFTEVENCLFTNNGIIGVEVGSGSRIVGVRASGNVDGIVAGDSSLVQDCVAEGNVNRGILLVGTGSRAEGCIANRNDLGIVASESNHVSNCTAEGNTNHGISLVGTDSRAENCLATGNNDGIRIEADRCAVVHCTSSENRADGITVGDIATSNSFCLIDENQLVNNAGSGIFVNGRDNLIIRNQAIGSSFPYFITDKNQVGTVVSARAAAPTTGSTGGNLGASVGPWANFAR